ncbi:hypothetical protein D6D28_08196 [Aureobasidium pullulans]|uniref:Uncharacterized protein n=1 Tax=Aureobasidium pullulans TaxID=5580 RepID=A0A4S8S8V7_AURPU|nr:hypothetical protein D6D28_08196 [Aureobasidium pullulans]
MLAAGCYCFTFRDHYSVVFYRGSSSLLGCISQLGLGSLGVYSMTMDSSDSTSFSVAGETSSAAQESSLPTGSKILVIVTSSIGAALVDVLKLRPRGHSTPYMARPEEYPIYFEQRYSVRSSRYPLSLKSKHKTKNLPGLPGPVTQPGAEMADKPPSVIMEPHMAYLKSSDKRFLNRAGTKKSQASNVPSISVRSVGDEPLSPTSSSHRHTRWSWTNSEAPSTPRLNIERKRTSNGSLAPNYKPVGFGNDYQLTAIQEDSLSPGLPVVHGMPRMGGVPDKAQELLETGGAGYLPPRVPSKSKSSAPWKSVFRG